MLAAAEPDTRCCTKRSIDRDVRGDSSLRRHLKRGGGAEAMNHTENIFSFERLDVWQVVLDAVELADAISAGLPSRCGEPSDQLRRASQSIAANLAEGLGKQGKDRLRFHGYALGSAYETAAHLEIAARLRLVAPDAHSELRARLLRVVSMLTP
jgi:four helix bundle protein